MNEMQVIPNPFPGLRPFELNEHHLFFGREGLSDELLERLTRTHFLSVVGTSGSGKSSLVRAGLLPLLYGGYMTQAGPSWRIAYFRPGDNPIRNLALALNELELFHINRDEDPEQGTPPVTQDVQSELIEAILRRSALGLIDFVRESIITEQENLLVVVDQFEELFRFKNEVQNEESGNDAAAFVKLLLEATREKTNRIYVVLTMRSDFLGDCAQFRDLPEVINEGQYLIPRMKRDQQREAICSPAAVYGVHMEPLLIHRLLNDVGDNPNQLPILQHALMRTWDYWLDHRTETIDLTSYQEIGGMSHALSLHADEAYNQLPDQRSRYIAEGLFKCLTEKASENREVRRPTKLRDICAILEADDEEVTSVIDVFREEGRSFLMPPVHTDLTPDSVIDISHESLIRGWQQLKVWVDEEADSASMYRRLAEDAVLHEQGEVGCWYDPALQRALDWYEKYKPNRFWGQRYHPAFDLALAFLEESRIQRDRELEEQERQRQEEARRQARELEAAQRLAESESRRAEEKTKSARRLKWMVAALAVMFLVATATAVYALNARSEAERQRGIALGQQQIAETQQRIAESRRREAEEQGRIAIQQTRIAQKESQRAISAEEKANYQASIAERERSKALSAAQLANQQAQIAKTNLNNATAANERDRTNRLGLVALEQGESTTAYNHFNNLLRGYDQDRSGRWWVLHNLGLMYRQAGDSEHANKYYLQALEELDKLDEELSKRIAKPGDEADSSLIARLRDEAVSDRVATLKRLADAYYGQGLYTDSAKHYEKVLGLLSQKTPDRLYLANIQSNLADVYVYLGRDAEAQRLYEGSLNVWSSIPAEPEIIATSNKLAQVYRRQGKYAEAETQLNNVIAIREAKLEPDHISLAATYNDLAMLYQQWNNASLAQSYYKLAQEIREKNSRPDQSDNAEADDLQEIERTYTSIGRFASAEKLYKREIALREKLLKPEDPALAIQLEEMARFYVSWKKYSDAEPLYERALRIREEVLKTVKDTKLRHDQQFELIDILWQTAHIYAEQGKYPLVEQLYKGALAIRETLFGTDTVASTGELAELGQLYSTQRRLRDAEATYKRIVRIWRNHIERVERGGVVSDTWIAVWMLASEDPEHRYNYGGDPSIYIDSSNALALLYQQQDLYSETEAQYAESVRSLDWLASRPVGRYGVTVYAAFGSGVILSKQYYAALAETLESYAGLLRKMGANRAADAAALELRAKQARENEAKAKKNENYP